MHFKWDHQCEDAFNKIKAYLMQPPILMSPILGKSLLLYVSTIEVSLGIFLAQQDNEGKERAIYYISRTLVQYELNYSPTKKACLALVSASQKLRHYLLSQSIKLIAKIDPLKYLLSKATLTGRLAKWIMILSEFDIEYIDRKSIKGQVIADQLAEPLLQDDRPFQIEFPDVDILIVTTKTWQLYFDGSYTQHGSGAGILFIIPQGYTIPKAYKLSFPCTNNTTKYEALVTSIKMVVEWKITQLQVFGDSHLVINQINDDYQTKDDKLMPYKKMVDDFKKYFVEITFEQIPRNDNKAADAMATLASLL